MATLHVPYRVVCVCLQSESEFRSVNWFDHWEHLLVCYLTVMMMNLWTYELMNWWTDELMNWWTDELWCWSVRVARPVIVAIVTPSRTSRRDLIVTHGVYARVFIALCGVPGRDLFHWSSSCTYIRAHVYIYTWHRYRYRYWDNGHLVMLQGSSDILGTSGSCSCWIMGKCIIRVS